MANTSKKQSLLKKTPAKKNTPQKSRKKIPAQRPAQIKQNSAAVDLKDQQSKSKKGLLITLAVIAIIILAIPKPTLLTYKKLDMMSQSVYWPGLFGYGAMLLDSNLHPKLDSDRNTLYLCADMHKVQSCQKYQVVADHGVFSAIGSYF